MQPQAIQRAVDILADARDAGISLAPLPADCRPADEDAGYQIQAALHRRFDADGRGTLAGYKIGCTTPVMQQMMSIPSPAYGGIRSTGIHHGHGTFRRENLARPGVECEVAVRIARDFGPGGGPFSRHDAARHVDACTAAIEVVDDRFIDFDSTGAPSFIADDFCHAGCVLGPMVEDWQAIDLAALRGVTVIGGVEQGSGLGADVMGHPLEAVAWLANRLAVTGIGLRAGQVVMTGSLVATKWIEAGSAEVRIEVAGLGEARAVFV